MSGIVVGPGSTVLPVGSPVNLYLLLLPPTDLSKISGNSVQWDIIYANETMTGNLHQNIDFLAITGSMLSLNITILLLASVQAKVGKGILKFAATSYAYSATSSTPTSTVYQSQTYTVASEISDQLNLVDQSLFIEPLYPAGTSVPAGMPLAFSVVAPVATAPLVPEAVPSLGNAGGPIPLTGHTVIWSFEKKSAMVSMNLCCSAQIIQCNSAA